MHKLERRREREVYGREDGNGVGNGIFVKAVKGNATFLFPFVDPVAVV